MSSLHVMILAAGQGKRMKSERPKVLHIVGGKALIEHAVMLAIQLKAKDVTIVVPREYRAIESVLAHELAKQIKIHYAVQQKPLGTGDALRCGLSKIPSRQGDVLVINSDIPFVSVKSLQRLINRHKRQQSCFSLLTAEVRDPKGLGRIIRNKDDSVLAIVEDKDATADQHKINEINLGGYLFDLDFLHKNIKRLKKNNNQKEYYLTDLLKIAVKQKRSVWAAKVKDPLEALGVNSQHHLYIINHIFYQRQKDFFMKQGVCFLGSEIFIDKGVKIAFGTVIESPCYLKAGTKIGKNCYIESGCTIKDSVLEDGALIKSSCYIDHARIGPDCQVGPFAHLRPGTRLLKKAKVGNFVETKKTQLGEGSKANHLTYLGDADIGKKVNVGAGTITCNYDGFKKYKTILENGVFIGSDTQLVAPVKVGEGAYVGAGTTVTDDVQSNSLVISRVRQKEIPDWANKHRQKNGKL